MKSNTLAVAVVRLQVPDLHEGHHYLLRSITTIHERVLVVIGETEARLTPDDPLTFDMRKKMVLAAYPNVIIDRLSDHPSDTAWSQSLDDLIRRHQISEVQLMEPLLYGGRDSFLKHYTGRCKTYELPPTPPVSGTEIREAVQPIDTLDFRAGVIFASKYRYPASYQVVDVAVVNKGEILLGQKKIDNGKWRFIGGFVSPGDKSLEAAAQREVREELGIEPGDATYVGSAQINDYRYPEGGSDRIMSAFFTLDFVFGSPKATDDLDACCWASLDKAECLMIPEHVGLYQMLRRHLLTKESPDAE